ncbi:MAG: hypothetical protein Q9209_000996 [Squamulea sp. 1 TL-2023]
MSFPFLSLPPELREMVYREFFRLRKNDAALRDWSGLADFDQKREKEKAERGLSKGLLLANKQINLEASRVLWREDYFHSVVVLVGCGVNVKGRWYFLDLERPVRHLPPVEQLPKLRNIHIHLPTASTDADFTTDLKAEWNTLSSNLIGLVCNDLAFLCPRLTNVVIYLSCRCPGQQSIKDDPRPEMAALLHGPDWQRCFKADGLTRLLQPIRRLRADKIRFRHDCKAPLVAELEPIFRDFTGIVQSSEPVEALTSIHCDWQNLRLEAKRRGHYERVRDELRRAWFGLRDVATGRHMPEAEEALKWVLQIAQKKMEECRWDESLMTAVVAPIV